MIIESKGKKIITKFTKEHHRKAFLSFCILGALVVRSSLLTDYAKSEQRQ